MAELEIRRRNYSDAAALLNGVTGHFTEIGRTWYQVKLGLVRAKIFAGEIEAAKTLAKNLIVSSRGICQITYGPGVIPGKPRSVAYVLSKLAHQFAAAGEQAVALELLNDPANAGCSSDWRILGCQARIAAVADDQAQAEGFALQAIQLASYWACAIQFIPLYVRARRQQGLAGLPSALWNSFEQAPLNVKHRLKISAIEELRRSGDPSWEGLGILCQATRSSRSPISTMQRWPIRISGSISKPSEPPTRRNSRKSSCLSMR